MLDGTFGSPGGWFHLRVNFTSPSWNAALGNSRSWFTVELAETEDAADPPADIAAFTRS